MTVYVKHKVLNNLGDKQEVPDVLITFFYILLNWNREKCIQNDFKADKFPSEYELDNEENDKHSLLLK